MLLVFFLDQFVKNIVLQNIDMGDTITIIPKFFYLTYVKNTDFPILDRFKTGMKYINSKVLDVFYEEKIKLKDKMPDEKTEDTKDTLEKEEVKNVQISLSLIDEKLKDIDNIIK